MIKKEINCPATRKYKSLYMLWSNEKMLMLCILFWVHFWKEVFDEQFQNKKRDDCHKTDFRNFSDPSHTANSAYEAHSVGVNLQIILSKAKPPRTTILSVPATPA